ncbi:MAG: cytochrome b N-terminal domain-containing protein [Phycisphaerales bacterium]|nr:cytochrome b N-terminal domain-containing protein [Phycisphaerales bacterium]
MIRMLKGAWEWIEDRTGIAEVVREPMTHPVPRSAKWWYVFGSCTLMFFMIQVVTGICLALVYAPSAATAYDSLLYLNYDVPMGWMLRAIHGWSSNAMVFMMLVHMVQVFLHGAYKYPREMTWIFGVALLLTTLGLAFTGQVMRWDADAYWGVGIGASMMGRFPVIGGWLTHLVLGGPIIGGDTLSRFFTLHVFVLPGIAIALIGGHLMMVLKQGISEDPKPGTPGAFVDKATYKAEYKERIRRKGIPFFPVAAQRDMVFCGVMLITLIIVAAWYGPIGPGPRPDPTLIDVTPRPDFPFLWIFAVLALLTPAVEDYLIITAAPILLLALFMVPFLGGTGARSPSSRPIAVLVVILLISGVGVLSMLGVTSPWSPHMQAWTSDAVPPSFVRSRSPLELQGAIVLQHSQCRNCHALDGIGGARGPDLSDVALRLTPDQLVRQVQQGGGNMPAFGKNLSSSETRAVVAFLDTCHPPGARPANRPGARLEALRELDAKRAGN